MDTEYIRLDGRNIDITLAHKAGATLRNGGTVAFPTETVYGLGANALDPDAVKKIFAAKGRPADNPLIVHVADASDVVPLVKEIPEPARLVMANFWPGPISIILQKSGLIPDIVSAGLPTVALRQPSHPVAAAIIRASGVPVAAPSANLSARPSPTCAQHVRQDLDGKIDMMVDGGICSVGLESTVLDLSGDVPAILRPGGVTPQMLRPLIGEVAHSLGKTDTDCAPKCPGMKYRHYSPKAQVCLVECGSGRAACVENISKEIARLCAESKREGKRVGVLTCAGEGSGAPADIFIACGETPGEYAANMFAALRQFDEQQADIIYAALPFDDEFSAAIRNRLYKAAGGRVVKV